MEKEKSKDEKILINLIYNILFEIDCDSLSKQLLKCDEKTGYYCSGFYMGISPPILWDMVEKNINKMNMESFEDVAKIYEKLKQGKKNITQKIRHIPKLDNFIYFAEDLDLDEDEYNNNTEEYIKKLDEQGLLNI